MAMSLICGFSRWTEMSRFRSSANFTASSSVSCTTGRDSPVAGWRTSAAIGGRPVWLVASLISSRMRASVICCAGALPAMPKTNMDARTLIDCFRVIADALRLLPVVAAAAPVVPFPVFVQLVQLDPLLGREHLPDMQELKRAHFVQVTSDRFHAIDLLDDLLFVRVGSNEP